MTALLLLGSGPLVTRPDLQYWHSVVQCPCPWWCRARYLPWALPNTPWKLRQPYHRGGIRQYPPRCLSQLYTCQDPSMLDSSRSAPCSGTTRAVLRVRFWNRAVCPFCWSQWFYIYTGTSLTEHLPFSSPTVYDDDPDQRTQHPPEWRRHRWPQQLQQNETKRNEKKEKKKAREWFRKEETTQNDTEI